MIRSIDNLAWLTDKITTGSFSQCYVKSNGYIWVLKFKIVLAVASLALGVLLCEMVLHLFYPQVFRRPEVWRFDAELGWSHVADSAGRLVSPEFDVEIRINSMGLRDREYARG